MGVAKYLHGVFLIQFSFGSQVCEKLATWDVLHQEVQVARVLGEAYKSNLVETIRRDAKETY